MSSTDKSSYLPTSGGGNTTQTNSKRVSHVEQSRGANSPSKAQLRTGGGVKVDEIVLETVGKRKGLRMLDHNQKNLNNRALKAKRSKEDEKMKSSSIRQPSKQPQKKSDIKESGSISNSNEQTSANSLFPSSSVSSSSTATAQIEPNTHLDGSSNTDLDMITSMQTHNLGAYGECPNAPVIPSVERFEDPIWSFYP